MPTILSMEEVRLDLSFGVEIKGRSNNMDRNSTSTLLPVMESFGSNKSMGNSKWDIGSISLP